MFYTMYGNQRDIKKKVVVKKYFYGKMFSCPSCGKHLGYDYTNVSDINYCQKCGQALEFERESKL